MHPSLIPGVKPGTLAGGRDAGCASVLGAARVDEERCSRVVLWRLIGPRQEDLEGVRSVARTGVVVLGGLAPEGVLDEERTVGLPVSNDLSAAT